jgi:MFS family permease
MLPPQFLGNPGNAVWFTSDSGFAFNMLIIVRVIGGTGVGITSVVAPVYIAELTLPKNRGKIVSIYQLSITLGILLAFLMDWIVLNHAGDAAGIITEEGASGFLNWLFVEEIWQRQ